MKKGISKQFGCLLIMLFFCCTTAIAQPEDNGGDPPTNDAPLDGGLSVLIAAGVGYGVKKARDNRKLSNNKEK